MTGEGYANLWKTLASLMVVCGALAWAHAAGAEVVNPIGWGYAQAQALIFSVPLYSLLVLGSLTLWAFYAAERSVDDRRRRMPVFWVDPMKFNFELASGRFYQTGCAVVFFVVPAACLIALHSFFWKQALFCDGTDGPLARPADVISPPVLECGLLRYAAPDGPQFFAVVTPVIYASLALVAAALWVLILVMVARPKRPIAAPVRKR